MLDLVGCWFWLSVGSGWVFGSGWALVLIGCCILLGVGFEWVLVLVGCWFRLGRERIPLGIPDGIPSGI